MKSMIVALLFLGLVACAVSVAVVAPYGYGYYGAPLAYRSAYVSPVVSSYSYSSYPYAYSAVYPYAGYGGYLLKK